jgi:hypothetical protein
MDICLEVCDALAMDIETFLEPVARPEISDTSLPQDDPAEEDPCAWFFDDMNAGSPPRSSGDGDGCTRTDAGGSVRACAHTRLRGTQWPALAHSLQDCLEEDWPAPAVAATVEQLFPDVPSAEEPPMLPGTSLSMRLAYAAFQSSAEPPLIRRLVGPSTALSRVLPSCLLAPLHGGYASALIDGLGRRARGSSAVGAMFQSTAFLILDPQFANGASEAAEALDHNRRVSGAEFIARLERRRGDVASEAGLADRLAGLGVELLSMQDLPSEALVLECQRREIVVVAGLERAVVEAASRLAGGEPLRDWRFLESHHIGRRPLHVRVVEAGWTPAEERRFVAAKPDGGEAAAHQDRYVLLSSPRAKADVVTVVVAGPVPVLCAVLERGVEGCRGRLQGAAETGRVLPGAGVAELVFMHALENYAQTLGGDGGHEVPLIEGFVDALRGLLVQTLLNAGWGYAAALERVSTCYDEVVAKLMAVGWGRPSSFDVKLEPQFVRALPQPCVQTSEVGTMRDCAGPVLDDVRRKRGTLQLSLRAVEVLSALEPPPRFGDGALEGALVDL